MSLDWQRDDEPVEYDCIWRFVDQSAPFVYGVEAGAIYQEMRGGAPRIAATTHAENEEEIRNLANSMGYSVAVDDLDETFQNVVFTKNDATPEQLRVASNAHVYHEHVTAGLDCWCKPTCQLPCDECENKGCWKCNDGGIPLTREQAEVEERPIVIVHNDR